MLFVGSVLGFNYNIEKESEAKFKVWLKAKLQRYILKTQDGIDVTDVLADLLGIKALEDRLAIVEAKP